MDRLSDALGLTADELGTIIVEGGPEAYVALDLSGTIVWANRRSADFMGLAPHQYLGHNLVEFLSPESIGAALQAFAEYTRPDRPDTGLVGPPVTLELQLADGTLRRVDARLVPTGPSVDEHGILLVRLDLRAANTVLYDAIELLVAEAPLLDVMASLVALVELESPYSVPVFGWEGHLGRYQSVVAADGAPRVSAEALPSGVGRAAPWRALDAGTTLAFDDLTDTHPALAEAAAAQGLHACWSMALSTDDRGHVDAVMVVWRRVPGPPALNVARRLERIGGIATLALRTNRSRRHLEVAARTDPLTGLHNRHALTEHLADIDELGTRRVVGACFCDLDDFKLVNDEHGHLMGDSLLVEAAQRVRAVVDGEHFVSRAGGDEFVVLCSVDDEDDVRVLAERLVEAFEEPFDLHGHRLHVRVTVGWTASRLGMAGLALRAEQLVERADRALLTAKSSGKRQALRF